MAVLRLTIEVKLVVGGAVVIFVFRVTLRHVQDQGQHRQRRRLQDAKAADWLELKRASDSFT